MKSLVESLFGKKSVSKKLPAEEEIKQFRNKDIAKLTSEEIKRKIYSIMGECDVYTYDELKKHPIDLLKHVIIIPTFGGTSVRDYVFVYSKDIPNRGIESMFNYIRQETKNWTWHNYTWKDFDGFEDWDKKVDCMRTVFISSNARTFYIIPEGLSKDLIKIMSGK